MNEAIEVAIVTGSGIGPENVTIELINGAIGLDYKTFRVHLEFTEGATYCAGTSNEVKLFYISLGLQVLIQNGPSDMIAVGVDSVLEEHFVYDWMEASPPAAVIQGLANGSTPVIYPIAYGHPTGSGFSLVGSSSPRNRHGFTWAIKPVTLGTVNDGQTFSC